MKSKIHFFVIILIISLLCSCGNAGDHDTSTSEVIEEIKSSSNDESGDQNIDSSDFPWLDTDDSSNFEIIEPDDSDEEIVFAVKDFFCAPIIYPASVEDSVIYSARIMHDYLKNNYLEEDIIDDEGNYPKNVTDYIEEYKNGTYRQESNYVQDQSENDTEILIGNTNRAASLKALELLGERKNNANDFVIMVYNYDVAIVGGSNSSLETGVRYFLEKYAAENEITLSNNFYCVFRPEYPTQDVQLGNIKVNNFQIVMPYVKSYIESREVYNLQELLANITGFNVPIVSDRDAKKDYELIIGIEKKNENGEQLSENEYAVYFKNSKLYVNAYDETTLAFAVNELNKNIREASNEGRNILLDKDKIICGKSSSASNLYSLKWNDEFNDENTDSYLKNFNYRAYQVGDMSTYYKGYLIGSVYGSASDTFGATVYYSPDERCMRVEDGKLVLEGHKIDDDTFVMPADLRSVGKFTFDYGYIEASIKLPYGPGTFPSFWICGDMENNPTSLEIDIFEAMGLSDLIQPDAFWYAKEKNNEYESESYNVVGEIRTAVPHNSFYFLPKGESFYDMYHTIGCEKMPDYFAIYYDGNLVAKFDTTVNGTGELDIFNQFMQIAFSMPVNTWQEVTDESILKWETDYVRFYQLPGIGSISNELR